jgi:hypothetical protein
MTRNTAPIAAMNQFMPHAVSVPGSLATPAMSTTIPLTAVRPAIHPPANAGPLERA